MTLRTKRLIILWATVTLIIIFLGLKTELYGQKNTYSSLKLYGFELGITITDPLVEKIVRLDPKVNEQYKEVTKGQPWGRSKIIGKLAYAGRYKYQLIVATFLIGFALYVSVKKK